MCDKSLQINNSFLSVTYTYSQFCDINCYKFFTMCNCKTGDKYVRICHMCDMFVLVTWVINMFIFVTHMYLSHVLESVKSIRTYDNLLSTKLQ